MKKKLISALLVIVMLFSLCGCSLASMEDDITEYKKTWFSNLQDSASDFSENWFSNLKESAESFSAYSFSDLQRDVKNLLSLDYESEKVAYEKDLISALADETGKGIITLQKDVTLSADMVVPSGKTLVVESGVIFIVPTDVSITIEDGASVIFQDSSYLVINELGNCTVADGGSLTISEKSCALMVADDALSYSSESIINFYGMVQKGSTFYAYSTQGFEVALLTASDGGVINIQTQALGSESEYTIFNIDKSVTITGMSWKDEETLESLQTAVYGGFVISADGVSISGFDIHTPAEDTKVSTPSSLAGLEFSGGITAIASSATISNNTIYISENASGVEIYPYYSEEGTQSYTISSNTFVGYGDVYSYTSSAIVVMENSDSMAGIAGASSEGLAIGISSQITMAKANSFEDCTLALSVFDHSSSVEIPRVVYAVDGEITSDYSVECNYYLLGNWNVSNGKVTVEDGVVFVIYSGAYMNIEESGTLEISSNSSVTLQTGATLETHSEIIGSLIASGTFIDWPNYIEFSIMVQEEDENGNTAWVQDELVGQYVGYTASQLKSVYIAKKQYGDFAGIVAYDVEFYLANESATSSSGVVLQNTPLADSYIFEEGTAVYAVLTGKILTISYDANGGNSTGSNRAEISYPNSIYLENATTNKSNSYFAGWTISGGTYSGKYISSIDETWLLKLFNAGYTNLNLVATWVSTDAFEETEVAYYLTRLTDYQFDDHCDVYLYSSQSTSEYTSSAYLNGTTGLTKVANGAGYNGTGVIFFDVEDGYQITSVVITESSSLIFNTDGYVSNGTSYDVTNEALIAYSQGLPFIWESEMEFCVEVTTKTAVDVQEISEISFSVNGGLTGIDTSQISGYVFSYDDTIKFFAKTEAGATVATFYVVVNLKDIYGSTTSVTYYNTDEITLGEDYSAGTVTFDFYPIEGRSVIADDFAFDYWFMIK